MSVEKNTLFLYNRCVRCLKWKYGDIVSFNIKSRRYLGSKARLLNFISETVKENCGEIKSIADIFAGTANVGWKFNKKDTKVILNDMLYSNYVVYEAFFGNEEVDNAKIKNLISKYNELSDVNDNYFSENFSDTFFSEFNCKKIGFIRDDIEELFESKEINSREKSILITSLLYAMDRIANTVGHYDAYRAHGDLDKKLLLEELELPSKDINNNNEYYCMDSNELVKQLSVDLVYIDPPYNSRQYCDAYHLLENVATWEKPEVFGTARKMDRSKLKSRYCLHSAPKTFDDLIQNISAKYILVSYNNMGSKGSGRSQAKISDEDIINSLSKRGKVKIFETDFQQFTTGKSKIEDHKERLFLCFVGEEKNVLKVEKNEEVGFIKSPLNYTGGKFKLMPQLVEKFPAHFNTFVDLFGGGFNVGVNIEAPLVIYNDKNKHVSKIIELFHKYGSFDIVEKIEGYISDFELSNTYQNGYEYYGCDSSSGVGSYNKVHYEKLRDYYNTYDKEDDEKYFILLTLIIFAFNNQIRFNSKGLYNMPVGKRDFNSSTRRNLKRFADKVKSMKIKVHHKEFDKLSISKMDNPFVYCDPPYFLGIAAYNESDGWTEKDERRLLNYLQKLDENGIRFALSNVIEHKGLTHTILKDWVEENHFNLIYIKSDYSNSNYQLKDKEAITREVLITNY